MKSLIECPKRAKCSKLTSAVVVIIHVYAYSFIPTFSVTSILSGCNEKEPDHRGVTLLLQLTCVHSVFAWRQGHFTAY